MPHRPDSEPRPARRDHPVDDAARLLRDPGSRWRGVLRLADALDSGADPDAVWAAAGTALPGDLDGPAEAVLALARVHERCGARTDGRPWPAWRTADLPVPVQVAWLRAELHAAPAEALRREPPGELLYQAARQTDTARTRLPEPLVAALAESGDPVLAAEALRCVREGLRTGLLAPAPARRHTVRLLRAGAPGVVADALRELCEPWAMLEPLSAGLLTGLLAGGPHGHEVAAAALTAAARHGHGDLVRRAVTDPDLPPGARRRALELLGDLAERDDIAPLVDLAATDPPLWGRAALTCLSGLHRRGHFPPPETAPTVVALALADHSIPPREAATVLYTCRRRAWGPLNEAAPDDPSWPRRLDLLLALAEQGTADLPVGAFVTRLLPSAAAPAPFLNAVRALRHQDAEEAVLALLPTAPAPALRALETMGGERTARALAEGLGLADERDGEGSLPRDPAAGDAGTAARAETGADGGAGEDENSAPGPADPPAETGIAVPLRPVRHEALTLLWRLTDTPERRRTLLSRLDPHDLPSGVMADLGAPDPAELAVLAARLDPDDPVGSLHTVAAHGDATPHAVLSDLLLRVVGDVAAAREPDAGPWPLGEGGSPEEPNVPQKVVDALSDLGRRLHARGRIRPVSLLDAADGRAAGRAFTASLALDLVERPDLTDNELVVLLELLTRVPFPGTRPRVHRLLRHRDPHVRKHAIALVAGRPTDEEDDASDVGDGARALSASLVALTSAPDIQTVRQAVSALGRARARWASGAIAACLDHANMNIRKTAARALVEAGTPSAVPALLRHLGRSDNPGLRAELLRALGAVLGETRTATVLAAAEGCAKQARRRLLRSLDGLLPLHTCAALADQGSPTARDLLVLVDAGDVRLADGVPEDLAAAMSAHEVTSAAGATSGQGHANAAADADVEALLQRGWDAKVALRLAARPEPPDPERLRRLRPRLAEFLRLAESGPTARVLRLALSACPAPRSEGERRLLARHAPTLVDGLADLAAASGGSHRVSTEIPSGPGEPGAVLVDELVDGLVRALEEAAPMLAADEAFAVVERLRALPLGAVDGRRALRSLRVLGAVPIRSDLDRALAAARSGPDPWAAETAVLREAFGIGTEEGRSDALPPHEAHAPGADDWYHALRAAVRSATDLADLRGTDLAAMADTDVRTETTDEPDTTGRTGATQRSNTTHGPGTTTEAGATGGIGTRRRLAALVEVYATAEPQARPLLVDWMCALQPLGAPPWTIGEDDRALPAPRPRAVRDDDLDQPLSLALRERLLALLRDPGHQRHDGAALRLAKWPDPRVRREVLDAYLRGHVMLSFGFDLRDTLTDALATADPRVWRAKEIRAERLLHVAAYLTQEALLPLVPLLLEWWEDGSAALRPDVVNLLHRVPADVLAGHLRERVESGGHGWLDLLRGRPLLRTAWLTRTVDRLRAQGRTDLADDLVLVDGPVCPPGTAARRADAVLRTLRERRPPRARPEPPGSPRADLLRLAGTSDPEMARRALRALVEDHRGPGPDTDPVLVDLLTDLMERSRPKVRLYAYRAARELLDRDTHLRLTVLLLDDPRPDVVRMAARTLCHARWEAAIPEVVGLLTHAHAVVRSTAAQGLTDLGAAAVPALRYAADHARPDRRGTYAEVLARIEADHD
ncbi:HEAT repeat domain-containing protein [Nocardiopsis lambiniae]|uniref:HEAT repeat domain-containing protein n=1 Tax=Nocardiopsis lambiniae TaxID=3075539 RepID=A0ABU2MEV2_9ACTN|nr:HEAT repeat domain-containing protein [Nocardiopsis sp. DSM 44743]MDT0331219.1 HEAT repeat domain-containing protein [Nocardiopsis sp. DSM 44743]